MKKVFILFCLYLLNPFFLQLKAQDGIQVEDTNGNILFEVREDGVLIKKVSTSERTALSLGTADNGLLVYDTDENAFFVWKSTAWEKVGGPDADADPQNEIQQLRTNGDTVFISEGNFVVLTGLKYLSRLINTDMEAPSAPANLIAQNATDRSVDLNWDEATDNFSLDCYEILFNGVKVGNSVSTSITLDGLSPGHYTATVRAKDFAGNTSPESSSIQVVITAINPLFVQQRLDQGETPLEIYNTGIILDSLYGKTYQGGFIFYLDIQTGNGFIAALVDLGIARLSCSVRIPEEPAVAFGRAVGTGQQNTTLLLARAPCMTYERAPERVDNYTDGTYSDWFLPSIEELNLMWVNLADSDGDGMNTGPTDPNNLGNFETARYNSSTETMNSLGGNQILFLNGTRSVRRKASSYFIRPVRAF